MFNARPGYQSSSTNNAQLPYVQVETINSPPWRSPDPPEIFKNYAKQLGSDPVSHDYPGYQATPVFGESNNRPHNVIITQQPSMGGAPFQRPARSMDASVIALVFGIISTIFFVSCGCWWAVPFSVVGIIFGATAISSGSNPNATHSKHHLCISLGCTIFAVALASIGIIVIILVIVLLVKY